MCLTPELRDVARVCRMMGFLVYMFNWIWSREWFHWKSTPPEIFADVFCLFVAVVSFFLREGFFWISGEKMLKRQGSVMNIHTPAPHLHINSFLLLNWSHSVPQMSINDKKMPVWILRTLSSEPSQKNQVFLWLLRQIFTRPVMGEFLTTSPFYLVWYLD